MMKDRLLKDKVLNYYIKRFWYPQLETNVLSKKRLSSVKKLVTDIDVLGLYQTPNGQSNYILGDCKTLKGQSPISRVLWLRGLMDYFNAENGLIVLTKECEKEHQLTASSLNIKLLSDAQFDIYSAGTADYLSDINSSIGIIENWEKFLGVSERYPRLREFIEFSQTQFWNTDSSNNKLRIGISVSRSLKGEVIPDNKLHQCIILNHFSLAAIALNDLVIQIYNQHLIPTNREEFDQYLKVVVYGGIENYDFLNNMRKRFITDEDPGELKLPRWDKFIELVRLILQNPLLFWDVSLLLKELSFELLSTGDTISNYASILVKRNQYLTLYSSKLVDYLCDASTFPSDMKEILIQKIYKLELHL